jgi:alpha-tubulin suppressor-like RCC1 family protein
LTPRQVVGGHSFALLTAGDDATCGLTATGAAYCWGYNYVGQLGDGSEHDSSKPILVRDAAGT